MTSARRFWRAPLARNLAVALAYLATARLGLTLALEHTNATAVWPPAGLALAACLAWGFGVWPGVFLGACGANLLALSTVTALSRGAVLVSLATAGGNTLEAVAGAWLVKRFAGDAPFDRIGGCSLFIALGALLSPVIAATVGTASFALSSANWSESGQMWLTWWLGDAVGALVFAPLFLTRTGGGAPGRRPARVAEAAALVALLVAIETVIFLGNVPLEYLAFPVLFWTAFRFGPFESAAMVAVMMVSFLLWTLTGLGPFAGHSANHTLLFLQSYFGVAAASTLLLSTVINARNRAEARVKEYQENLERLVDERTAELRLTLDELELAKEQAVAADHLKTAFLATMSHELRTPLNSIIGFTGILLQRLGGPLNGEQEKQLGMVKNSAGHLLALISDVLDISKIEAGQLTVSSETFRLDELVGKAVQTIRPLAERKGLTLSVEVGEGVGSMTGDERRVEQVLLNLMSNAVKFTERGRVGISCRREGESYLTVVRDTGIGIDTTQLDLLFKPFRQLDSGLSRRYEGTGLGLSICKKLVELMGGKIDVESRPGEGSTFAVTLPAAAA